MANTGRTGVALAGLLAISACTTPAPPAKTVALLEGQVTATSPAGYCVDQIASNPRQGFAVMAPCVTLGSGDPVPDAIGVATVQVGEANSGGIVGAEPALRDLLESEAGAVLLSTDGNADTITVLGSQIDDNSVVVHFADSAEPLIAGLQGDEWRAFLDLDGRLVTVAVRGLATAPLQDGTAAWLLDLVVTGLLATGNSESETTPEA